MSLVRAVRGKAFLIALGALATIALGLPGASSAKIVDRVVVNPGAVPGGSGARTQGLLDGVEGIAVNDPGVADPGTDPQGASVDGYVYVTEWSNHRVQVFDAAGNFEFMFGRGVRTGGDGAEVCDHTQVPCGAPSPQGDGGEGEFWFSLNSQIAVDQQSGDLYVSDTTNARIQQFEADGTFVRTWGWDVAGPGSPDDTGTGFEICTSGCQRGVTGEGGGQFRANDPGGIAVDPAAPHHVFVVGGNGSNRVQEFEPDGDFVRLWGRGVVHPGQPGDVGPGAFEICTSTAPGVCAWAEHAFVDTDYALDVPESIAVDGTTGIAYVAHRREILRFDTDATDTAGLALPRIPGSSAARAVTLDHPTGNLLAAYTAGGSAEVSHIREYSTGVGTPVEVQRHVENTTGAKIEALAVHPASGDIYLATQSSNVSRVLAADADGAPPPSGVVIDDPTPTLNGPNVVFSGEVTPNGPAGMNATYNFQYRRTGSGEGGWITLPGSENPLGTGAAPVQVSDAVSDLQPNSGYEVRLAARKPFGNPEVLSQTLSFTSATIPPGALTLPPAQRGPMTATLTAVVNPNNSPTTYRFEWGESEAYGHSAPVPAGYAGDDFGDRIVTASIAGLDPETTYHYRVIADNGVEVSPGETQVPGENVSFVTREAIEPQGERGLEMVTPPFKVTRQSGNPNDQPGDNPNPAIASLDGESMHWNISVMPLTEDVQSPMSGDKRIIRRTPAGWVNATRNTLGLLPGTSGFDAVFPPGFLIIATPGATSGDFETLTWAVRQNRPTSAGLLPTEGQYANRLYTRRDGTGVNGFTPWLTNPERQIVDQGFHAGMPSNVDEIVQGAAENALINDSGSAMARWGHYRGLAEDPDSAGDDDPSDEQLLAGQMGGAAAYVQRAADPDDLPSAAKELVNGCTGTVAGGDATLVPSRIGSGLATDTIGTRACARGDVVNVRGATVGNAAGVAAAAGRAATALSDDGRRVFFQSPDRAAATEATGSTPHPSISACTAATGANTACPPQLFVRQHDSEGEPTVRWISHSRSEAQGDGSYSGAMIAGQQIDLIGAGTRFEGASRDGSVVYFRTNAPLTPDDPNGTGSPGPHTAGTASDSSWDLYRYELPAVPGANPADGTLMRVSGGPTGASDPGVVNSADNHASVRFHSDDGERVYFLTTAPIAGAEETPPQGSSTSPGGAVGNSATRNLYLFDAAKGGAERWTFIARVPVGALGEAGELNACATSFEEVGEHIRGAGLTSTNDKNCFRGLPSGDAVLFASAGRLALDDLDEAADLYLYDAEADELARITAPPTGEMEPYRCRVSNTDVPSSVCNGELSRNTGDGFFSGPISSWEQSRGWGGMRYYNLSTDENGVVSAYFATKLPLVPEDTNGDKMDVYEWRNGELSMISPAGTPQPSWYSGSSLDGRDVFFVTGARLDPREIDDDDQDVYNARIGGGFPYTPPPVPCDVLALECESDATSGASPAPLATLAVRPSGNLRPALPGKGGCAKVARNAKKASRNAKRYRRAARGTSGPRSRKLAKRARKAAGNAKRASIGAKRCRHRAARQANADRRGGR